MEPSYASEVSQMHFKDMFVYATNHLLILVTISIHLFQVLLLERRVAELEKESEASGEQHARLRQENLQLVHRANALEEQLKEQELQADEELQQETRRHKESLNKLEREKGLELENLQAR